MKLMLTITDNTLTIEQMNKRTNDVLPEECSEEEELDMKLITMRQLHVP